MLETFDDLYRRDKRKRKKMCELICGGAHRMMLSCAPVDADAQKV